MTGTKLTLAQAARAVRMRAEKIDQRPDGLMMDDWGRGEPTHWRLTLTRRAPDRAGMRHRDFRRSWTVYWTQGSAYGDTPPETLDVLESLWLDVQGVENAVGVRLRIPHSRPADIFGFEDWCVEYGYDTDSRRAEKIWRACVKAARAWGRFWGGVELVGGEQDK